jgi:hypothetical protein
MKKCVTVQKPFLMINNYVNMVKLIPVITFTIICHIKNNYSKSIEYNDGIEFS